MKILCLAEKPSVGKDIARILSCKNFSNGYAEGSQYIVTWALGHLVTLADPEKYDPKYKSWKLEDLPIIPEKPKLVVIKETSKQYFTIKNLLERKDVSSVIIATDAGREGELVARWILEKSGCKKPVKRLWISSVTDKAIKDGFNKLRDGKEYINLANSAKARAEADWLVGINGTRCLTTKYNSQLSCGRVQTPTVAIINKREEEIKNFIAKKYYTLQLISENIDFIWYDKNSNDSKTFDLEKITNIYNSLKTFSEIEITNVTKAKKKSYPSGLYDLTELQRDASNRYNFSPKETLSIMQKLYEEHKVLTYPRTDSKYISDDIVETLKERLNACNVRPYNKFTQNILQRGISVNSSFVDNKKVSDHHAIIPTEQPLLINNLNEKERKIYDLVIMRFFSVLYPPFEYEQTTIEAQVNSEKFIAKGRFVLNKGFKEIYQTDEESESYKPLINIKKSDKLKILNLNITTDKTKPPSAFNEATLLSAMENPGKYMEDVNKSLGKILGETGGLGTVATRADIIEKLFDSFLIEKKEKDILTTSKGRQLLKLAPNDLKSPNLTGEWELKLNKISTGELKKDSFIDDIKKYTCTIVSEIKQSTEIFRHDNITNTKCPDCGKFMLKVNGKKGQMLVCQDRECSYRESLSMKTNSRCPVCHKYLEIVGKDDNKKLVCNTCAHKESYENFSKRIKNKNSALSKKDLQIYISKINNQEDTPEKSPFDALKDLKF